MADWAIDYLQFHQPTNWRRTVASHMHFGKESYKELLKNGRIFSAIYKFFQMLFYRGFRAWSSTVQLHTYQDMPFEEQRALKEKALSGNGRYVYVEAYYLFYGELDLSGISFNKDIMARFDDFRKKTGPYDAMHIRRTDNVAAIEKSPTQLFYDKIEEIVHGEAGTNQSRTTTDAFGEANNKIYIATDDANILKDIIAKYPSNICSEANTAASRTSSEGMRFALYEMLILSGAETLYASYGSTFTVIANAIGGNSMVTLTRQN